MIKAYNRPNTISVEYLTNILGFNSVEDTRDFFGSYGLEIDDLTVQLDKNSFYEPEFPVAPCRSEVSFFLFLYKQNVQKSVEFLLSAYKV